MTTTDIHNINDIKLLVNSFYDRVKLDPQIGPIFIGVIRDNWPAHLEKMYRFWQTVLLDEHSYHGSPFAPHAQMPLEQRHFETWIGLFVRTVDEHFAGPKADEAKWRAQKMAEMFHYKIQFLNKNPRQSIF